MLVPEAYTMGLSSEVIMRFSLERITADPD